MTSDNPFTDPNPSFEDNPHDSSFAIESTLAVGRDATLTLATDSLIVLDEDLDQKSSSSCCGLIPRTVATRAIPFYNILWAELLDSQLSIQYAHPVSKTRVRASELKYAVEQPMLDKAQRWITKLLDRSYKESQQRKRLYILVNPNAGPGHAAQMYAQDVEPLLRAARCTFDTVTTKYSKQAISLVENLDVENYDVIASCSGDGMPYEIFNGLGKKKDAKKVLSKIAVVNLPCGSGNGMSWNLFGTDSVSLATLGLIKGIATPLDLTSVTQGESRTLSFLSQTVGIVAEADLATEHLRWMGGQRFTYGFLTRLMDKRCYPCDIAVKVAIDDKAAIKEFYKKERGKIEPANERRGYKNLPEDDASTVSGNEDGLPPLRYGTVNDKLPEGWEVVPYDNMGVFYSGNMSYMAKDGNFFPGALPSDGYQDLVCVDGDVGRGNMLKMMLKVEDNQFYDVPHVRYQKVLGYRIIPKQQADGYISIDGERVPFQPFQAEVHKGLGTTLTKSGYFYESPPLA